MPPLKPPMNHLLLRLPARTLPRVRHPARRFASTKTSNTYLWFSPGKSAWYASVVGIGAFFGYFIITPFINPTPPSIPGSIEDRHDLESILFKIDNLDLVKRMRRESLPPRLEKNLLERGKTKAGWRELDIRMNIAEDPRPGKGNGDTVADVDGAEKRITRTFTQETIAGSRGLGLQRAFWNSETKELVAVVWMGAAITGWPTVTHGGAIATVFDEVMQRVVAGPDGSLDDVPEPSSLALNYKLPTYAPSLYILRATCPNMPDRPSTAPVQAAPPPEPQPPASRSWLPWSKDFTKKDLKKEAEAVPVVQRVWTGPPVEIVATLETLQGKICVQAKGSFPASAFQ